MNEILKLTNKKDWGYCPSGEKPAYSRGMFGSELKHEMLWWKSPRWLSQDDSKWPQNETIIETSESDSEKKVSAIHTLVVETTTPGDVSLV